MDEDGWGDGRRQRNGRAVRSEFTVLSATPAAPGWKAVYALTLEDEDAGEDGPFLRGVEMWTAEVYAIVLVRERECYADTSEPVPGCCWERVEMLDAESASDGFSPWELEDFLGYAPPGHVFLEHDRFWFAANRFWHREEARAAAGHRAAAVFARERREARAGAAQQGAHAGHA